MAIFGQGQQPSKFGAKPVSSPQKPLTQRSTVIQKSIPSKPIPPRPVLTKPAPPKPILKKTIPQKPKTLFGEKKDWARRDFISRVAKNPFSIKGKGYSFYERKKMVDTTFLPSRFSTYISERETKTRLRELRREEYRAKTGADKLKLSRTRKYLEKQTGLQGKY